jgi:hypothetical protein
LDSNYLIRVRSIVYTDHMKNITFSAQEQAIERARQVAAKRHRTLNELFREWLEDLDVQTQENNVIDKLEALWGETNYLRVGKKLSREEMNER